MACDGVESRPRSGRRWIPVRHAGLGSLPRPQRRCCRRANRPARARVRSETKFRRVYLIGLISDGPAGAAVWPGSRSARQHRPDRPSQRKCKITLNWYNQRAVNHEGRFATTRRGRGPMNRRDFIRASTAGLAAATIPAAGSAQPRAADNIMSEGQLGSLRSASPSDLQGLVGDGRQRRILLRGGVVLSLDPRVGDFEKADVLIDGKRIAEVAPTVSAGDAEIVDCTGTI